MYSSLYDDEVGEYICDRYGAIWVDVSQPEARHDAKREMIRIRSG